MEAVIKKQLIAMRKTGLPLNVVTIRGGIVAPVKKMAPEIFEKRNAKGEVFRASDPFIRRYLKQTIHWSLRRGTRAAGEVPQDATAILLRALIRMVCHIRDEAIYSCFIIDANQSQVVYAHGSNTA